MDTKARALKVLNEIDSLVVAEQGYDNLPTCKIAVPIEAAIRAAENEALDRAAAEVEQPLSRLDTLSGPFVDGFSRLLSCVLRAMAANVRSLKAKETP